MPAEVCYYFFYLAAFCLINSCTGNDPDKPAIWKEEIMKTDRDFSDMSRQQGMKKAFIEYIDNDGILLRPQHLPIIGADAIDFLSQTNDTSLTLTWQPSAADVSSSGDLGFTYGIYSLRLPDTLLSGTYVSIWKKRNGKWKFILDSGNEGIAPVR